MSNVGTFLLASDGFEDRTPDVLLDRQVRYATGL